MSAESEQEIFNEVIDSKMLVWEAHTAMTDAFKRQGTTVRVELTSNISKPMIQTLTQAREPHDVHIYLLDNFPKEQLRLKVFEQLNPKDLN